MAADDLALGEGWIKVRREQSPVKFSPTITVRAKGTFALSADFVRMAAIDDNSMASLYLSQDGRAVAFRFHDDETDADAYRVGPDGGRGIRASKGRLIVANAIFKQSATLAAMQRDRRAVRRLEPKRLAPNVWVISLAPCFESVWTGPGSIVGDHSGIYRYLDGAETVYIGRGHLKSRFSEPERRQWQFSKIEYSILNDEATERQWESFWLDEYRQRCNRWPIYNRISGSIAKTG